MFSLAKKLSLTVRGVMASAIDNLFTALKGRATYSENIADSKQVVKDIDNYELLDKASILLTPTAYSDARVHSVKTYTGDELVINETSKSVNTGGVYTDILTDINATLGQKLQVTYTLTGIEGDIQIWSYTNYTKIYSPIHSTDGTYTATIDITGNNSSLDLRFYSPSGRTGTISNVSVVDVSSDFDFDRASSATRINSDGLVQDMQSITDPELVLNGDFEELGDDAVTNGTFDTDSGWFKSSQSTISNGAARILSTDGSYQYIAQTKIEYTNTQSKYVKITLDIVNYVSGTLKAQFSGGTSYSFPTSVGTHTIYVLNDGSSGTFNLARVAGVTDITIDNVSVQQVDPNDRWSLGTGWSIEDGELVGDGTMTASDVVIQYYNFTDGNTYKFSFEITESSQGSVFIREPFNGGSDAVGTVGTHTFNYVAGAANELRLRSSDSFIGKIDNISVKDITFSEDVDLARINYDSNGENGHWLLEPTSTNLITYSEDFEQWTSVNVEVVNNATTSPNGGVNATLIKGNTNTSRHNVNEPSITNTVTASFSVFAKAKELRYLQIASANSTNQVANFDLLNGTIGDVGAGFSDVVIEEYPNDWYKISLVSANQYNSYYISLVSSTTASWLESWSMSNNTDGLYIWGAQLEELSFPTSYIPTLTGSTVTRATETLTGSGNSTLINSTEGVLYVEALMQDTGAFKTAARITATDTSTTDGMWIYFKSDNKIQSVLRVGGVDQTGIQSGVKTTNQYYKVAFKFKQNDFALWIDGIEVATDSSGNTFSADTLSKVGFVLDTSINPFYGKVKALAVFDEALEDDELELLTGITNYGSFNELAQANGYTII